MDQVIAHTLGIRERGDPSVAQLTCEFDRLGAIGRDVNWNPVLDIDVAAFGMQEANPSLAVARVEQHLIAAEQRAAALYVLAKAIERNRRQAHRIAPGESGADTQHRAARRELVDGRDRMSGDRLDAVGWNRNAGAELDAFG